jgi:hypothetical protein
LDFLSLARTVTGNAGVVEHGIRDGQRNLCPIFPLHQPSPDDNCHSRPWPVTDRKRPLHGQIRFDSDAALDFFFFAIFQSVKLPSLAFSPVGTAPAISSREGIEK